MSLVRCEDLHYAYLAGTPFETPALHGVSFTIEQGQCIGLAGPTGCGKSTLIQLLNGLLHPTAGRVLVNQISVEAGGDLKALRRTVGLLFQFPEHQLFEETVERDIAYGLRQHRVPSAKIPDRVTEAMARVGLSESYRHRAPDTLSGGERRLAALAGVLALEPQVLVLDEPTVGLDPEARDRLWRLLEDLHRQGLTLVVASHLLEELAPRVDRLLVLAQGRLVLEGSPREVLARRDHLGKLGMELPAPARLVAALSARGWTLPWTAVTEQEACEAIAGARR